MGSIMIGVTKKDMVTMRTYNKRNQECMILLRRLNKKSREGQVTQQGGMTTGGHAKQPIGLQETGQEKEGDKTEDGEMKYLQGHCLATDSARVE